jgi:ATP-binding cassette subfamily F protein 3
LFEEKANAKSNPQPQPIDDKLQTTNVAREQKKELQRLQKQFNKLEEEINQHNEKKAGLELELAKPENYADKNKFQQLENDYKNIQQKIAKANITYEQLFEKIMELEAG